MYYNLFNQFPVDIWVVLSLAEVISKVKVGSVHSDPGLCFDSRYLLDCWNNWEAFVETG